MSLVAQLPSRGSSQPGTALIDRCLETSRTRGIDCPQTSLTVDVGGTVDRRGMPWKAKVHPRVGAKVERSAGRTGQRDRALPQLRNQSTARVGVDLAIPRQRTRPRRERTSVAATEDITDGDLTGDRGPRRRSPHRAASSRSPTPVATLRVGDRELADVTLGSTSRCARAWSRSRTRAETTDM